MSNETAVQAGQRQAKENQQRNDRQQFAAAMHDIGRIASGAYDNINMWRRYERAYDNLVRAAQIIAAYGDAPKIPVRLTPKVEAGEMVEVKLVAPGPTVVQITSTSLAGSAIPEFTDHGPVF